MSVRCFSITLRSKTCPVLTETTASFRACPENAQFVIDIFFSICIVLPKLSFEECRDHELMQVCFEECMDYELAQVCFEECMDQRKT